MTLSETTATLPVIVPISDAAREMGVDEATLRDMVKLGKIRAFVDPEGVMYVQMTQQGTLPVAVAEDTRQPPDDINARLSRIRREDFAHLEGVPITVSEAARKYGVSPQTLHNWIKKGYIVPIQKGVSKSFPTICNEAEVAYCVEIYRVRKSFGTLFGVPLLKEDGTPYLLKHPALSRYRRQQQD